MIHPPKEGYQQLVSNISYKDTIPQHPIGSSIIKRISEENRRSSELCLIWASKLLNKKHVGKEYLIAGSDWLEKSLQHVEMDRRPSFIIKNAITIASGHFNEAAIVNMLQKASKQRPESIVLGQQLKIKSENLANELIENGHFTEAKEAIEKLIELVPKTGDYREIQVLLNRANIAIAESHLDIDHN